MFFVTSSPPHMSLAGAAAPSLPQGMTFEGVPMMADGNAATAVGMHGATAMNITSNSSAPPSYEAIVLDPNGPRSQTNLFVRKLASAVKEKDLKTMFERYGTIMSFALMRDIHTGESLGTAFVRYRTHEEARAAMAGLDGTELYGRPISIQWAKKEHDGTPCGDARRKIHKLFVRNIPLTVTARHLRQVFSQFGSINNVTLHSDTAPAVPRDAPADTQAGQMRNIAFILFQEDGAAERAVSALHNTCPFPSCEGIPLMVKLAEDNRDRLGRKQKADNGMLNPAAAPPIMIAANGQPATISTPVSTTISPAQMSLDPGAAHILGATMLPTNLGQGLPFSMASNGATAGAPLLQATTDANGNTTYVYVTGPASTAPRMIASPASGSFFVQTPAGLQAFAAPMQAAQLPAYYTPTTTNIIGTAGSATATATPNAATLQPQAQQAYFPSMAVPSMFVDAQGNPVTPMQQNIIMPNFYSPYTSQQTQMMAQQQQQFMIHQQQVSPQSASKQKRSSLPSFAEAASATGQLSMMMTPNQPCMKTSGTAAPKGTNQRSPAAQQLQPRQPSTPQHPEIISNHSVSPQLSSAASNANLVATAGSSVVATPMDGGMAVPTNTLLPASAAQRLQMPVTVMPVGMATNISGSSSGAAVATAVPTAAAAEDEDASPTFHYDSLQMNEGNNSLTVTSSMTMANDMLVSAMHFGIEEDEVSQSDSEAPVAAPSQPAKH
jgi:RNA recognition motif-containing protein